MHQERERGQKLGTVIINFHNYYFLFSYFLFIYFFFIFFFLFHIYYYFFFYFYFIFFIYFFLFIFCLIFFFFFVFTLFYILFFKKGSGKETDFSKYVKKNFSTNPTTLISISLVSEF